MWFRHGKMRRVPDRCIRYFLTERCPVIARLTELDSILESPNPRLTKTKQASLHKTLFARVRDGLYLNLVPMTAKYDSMFRNDDRLTLMRCVMTKSSTIMMWNDTELWKLAHWDRMMWLVALEWMLRLKTRWWRLWAWRLTGYHTSHTVCVCLNEPGTLL